MKINPSSRAKEVPGMQKEEMGEERRFEGVIGALLRPFNIPLYPFASVQATRQTAREDN